MCLKIKKPMLTIEKVKIYKSFNGDIDGWARIGTDEELNLMEDEDWRLIDEIIQDIKIIKNGYASDVFKEKFETKLIEHQIDKNTLVYLKQVF